MYQSANSDLNNNADNNDQTFEDSADLKPQLSAPIENRLGLAARRAAQLPKLRDINRRLRPDSSDMDPVFNVPHLNPSSIEINFQYGDCDILLHELSELYSYSEEQEMVECANAFLTFAQNRSIFGWAKLLDQKKKDFLMSLIEELEMTELERRRNALQCLAYLLLGNFLEWESDTDVVPSISSNVYLIYEYGIWSSMLSMFLEEDEKTFQLIGQKSSNSTSRGSTMLDVSDSKWLRMTLNCLYTMLEVIRRDDSATWRQDFNLSEKDIAKRLKLRQCFIEELGYPITPGGFDCSSFERKHLGAQNTLAEILFDAVSRFCSPQMTIAGPHLPIKKILLILWKTALTWLGDSSQLIKQKNEMRKKQNLPPADDTVSIASLMEPVAVPGGAGNILGDLMSMDSSSCSMRRERPLLAKRQFACMAVDDEFRKSDSTEESSEEVPDDPKQTSEKDQDSPTTPTPQNPPSSEISAGRPDSPRPEPPTPLAPVATQHTPKVLPWSLKVRRQDIEDFLDRERSKFFNFQLANDNTTLAGLPKPIVDSVDTLRKHLYVSMADLQSQQETLLNKYPFSHKHVDLETLQHPPPAELLYQAVLPHMAQYVIGLLKILLAGAPTSKPKTDSINILTEIMNVQSIDLFLKSGGVDLHNLAASVHNETDQSIQSNQLALLKLNLEVNRHKEILVKAISALILLMLKHFKLNHVYQFEYLSQHLVFANCIPLILKFFDQNVIAYVQSENEVLPVAFPANMLNYAKNKQLRFSGELSDWPLEHLEADRTPNASSASSQSSAARHSLLWRNIFAAVNLLRVLNKLTKWKHTRTMMLVVFKSAPVLKRALRVRHILVQLYALKLLKMQAKYLGRQWRKTNMELMSAIYNKVRHRLNDNWAYGNETQAKPWDFQLEETSLREAVEKFNARRYKDLLRLSVLRGQTNGNNALCSSLAAANCDSGKDAADGNCFDEDSFFDPVDSNVVSVLGTKFELTDRFKLYYKNWLEQEVFQANIDWDQLMCNERRNNK